MSTPIDQTKTPSVYIHETDAVAALQLNIHHHIYDTVSVIVKQLNEYLKTLFSAKEDAVALSSLTSSDGAPAPVTSNKVVLQILTIGKVAIMEAEEATKGNAYTLMLSANFNEQALAIKYIGAVADFFQFSCPQGKAKYINNSKDLRVYPIDCNLSQLAQLFGALRKAYIPSLLYQLIIPSFSPDFFAHLHPNKSDEENVKQEIEVAINEILRQFVFEPNTYPTWLAIQYLVDEYLFSQQKAGKLQDSATEESYTVNIGLGTTMTGMDILNGYLVLNVMLKLKDQEDYLVLTFKNQLVQI